MKNCKILSCSVASTQNSLCWFVSGLVDAEGSFGVNVVRKESSKIGYSVLIYFEIALNKKDKQLLETTKQVLGIEKDLYYNKSDDTLKLKDSLRTNLDELINNVIPHFNKYPLCVAYTKKSRLSINVQSTKNSTRKKTFNFGRFKWNT